MYGKYFVSTFNGSMYGAGPVIFAVWGYVIAHTVDSQVELNPKALAPMIGTTVEEICQAIEFLCRPDVESRNKDEEGRRLVREGQFAYRVPSWDHYHNILNETERREYNRQKKAEQRVRDRQHKSKRQSMTVIEMSAVSAQEEEEEEAVKEKERKKEKGNSLGVPKQGTQEYATYIARLQAKLAHEAHHPTPAPYPPAIFQPSKPMHPLPDPNA